MSNGSALPHRLLSIVVPLYNEEEGIAQLIQGIFSVLSTDPDFLELVLVDDGSYDRTAELVSKLAEFEQRIRLLGLADDSSVPDRGPISIHQPAV